MTETHPIQVSDSPSRILSTVTLRAYEVYCALYGPQEAMVTGDCRGGFSLRELIAFLYARSFPREEWGQRFFEALEVRIWRLK